MPMVGMSIDVGDHSGDLVGHALEHDREAPGGFERLRVVDERERGVVLTPCTLNPPMACTDCGVSPMWPITGISASTMASIIGTRLRPPSSFTACGAGANQRGRVADRVVDRHVVAHPRQVADDQRRRLGPGDRGRVVGHVVDGHLQRVVVAEHDHGDGIADEDHVDARLVGHAAPGASYAVTMTSGSAPARTLRADTAGAVTLRCP